MWRRRRLDGCFVVKMRIDLTALRHTERRQLNLSACTSVAIVKRQDGANERNERNRELTERKKKIYPNAVRFNEVETKRSDFYGDQFGIYDISFSFPFFHIRIRV